MWGGVRTAPGCTAHTVAPHVEHLDLWNLMAYDFSGTWSQRATHQANLFSTPATDASVDSAIGFYNSQGVAPSKLVLGMPLYARAFANTDGIGQPFQGVPEGGAEPGNFYYNVRLVGAAASSTPNAHPSSAGPPAAWPHGALRLSCAGHLFPQSSQSRSCVV